MWWKRIGNTSMKLLAVALTMCYLGTVVPFHQHDVLSHELDVAHTETIHASDNCHNYIFHGIQNDACKKHTHASTDTTPCLICHYFKNIHNHLPPAPDYFESHIYIYEQEASLQEEVALTAIFTQPHRGPPFIV